MNEGDWMLIAIGIAWVASSVINYAIILAHFQRSFPLIAEQVLTDDRIFSATVSVLGPISLVAGIMFCLTHGGLKGLQWK